MGARDRCLPREERQLSVAHTLGRWPTKGARVSVQQGRKFPHFGAGDAGVVVDVDPEASTCKVAFDGREADGPFQVATRHLRPEAPAAALAPPDCAGTGQLGKAGPREPEVGTPATDSRLSALEAKVEQLLEAKLEQLLEQLQEPLQSGGDSSHAEWQRLDSVEERLWALEETLSARVGAVADQVASEAGLREEAEREAALQVAELRQEVAAATRAAAEEGATGPSAATEAPGLQPEVAMAARAAAAESAAAASAAGREALEELVKTLATRTRQDVERLWRRHREEAERWQELALWRRQVSQELRAAQAPRAEAERATAPLAGDEPAAEAAAHEPELSLKLSVVPAVPPAPRAASAAAATPGAALGRTGSVNLWCSSQGLAVVSGAGDAVHGTGIDHEKGGGPAAGLSLLAQPQLLPTPQRHTRRPRWCEVASPQVRQAHGLVPGARACLPAPQTSPARSLSQGSLLERLCTPPRRPPPERASLGAGGGAFQRARD